MTAYPLMKRFFAIPQLFLGVTFNWGTLMGWSVLHNSVSTAVTAPLLASAVAWTLVYDTIYAHSDKVDDAKVGVLSSALTFGDNTKPILAALSVASGAALTASAYAAGMPIPVVTAAGVGMTAHMLWQLRRVSLDSPADCIKTFRQNAWIGRGIAVLFVGGNAFVYLTTPEPMAGDMSS